MPFPGVKWRGCKADISPPFSPEVKNEWSYTAAFHIRLQEMYRENFTFTVITVIKFGGSLQLERTTLNHTQIIQISTLFIAPAHPEENLHTQGAAAALKTLGTQTRTSKRNYMYSSEPM